MSRTWDERNKKDCAKAIRKKKISQKYSVLSHTEEGWYNCLGKYKKGKIHCSCPMCSSKTRKKNRLGGSVEEWKPSDQRKNEDANFQLNEYNKEIPDEDD